MTVGDVEAWVDGYVAAWDSNDPEAIAALFAENAAYYTEPFREPWRGRETIVANWLDRRDEPGTWRFRYEVLAVADAIGFVRGWTSYTNPPRDYSNLWVVKLDADGRCSEFTEWWMKHRE